MRTLICGSIAYDTIMVFHDQFKNHILPDQLHILNVAFLVPDMRREFGGCAGNIAYTLKMLGGEPMIMATVGDDHQAYSYRLDKLHLAAGARPQGARYVHGAGLHHHRSRRQPDHGVPSRRDEPLAPEPRAATQKTSVSASSRPTGATACCSMRANFMTRASLLFSIPARGCRCSTARNCSSSCALRTMSRSTTTKAQMLQERTGKKIEELAKLVKALVVTLGARGSVIYSGGQQIEIPCVKAEAVARSDRLRRRVPCRAAVRDRCRTGLAADRQAGCADRRDQDRPTRRTESPFHARRNRPALQGKFRHPDLVS